MLWYCRTSCCRQSLLVCSGDMYEVGMDQGRYYSVNLPLKDGINDLSECEQAKWCSEPEWCSVVWGGVVWWFEWDILGYYRRKGGWEVLLRV